MLLKWRLLLNRLKTRRWESCLGDIASQAMQVTLATNETAIIFCRMRRSASETAFILSLLSTYPSTYWTEITLDTVHYFGKNVSKIKCHHKRSDNVLDYSLVLYYLTSLQYWRIISITLMFCGDVSALTPQLWHCYPVNAKLLLYSEIVPWNCRWKLIPRL